jgi:hypothetical protein
MAVNIPALTKSPKTGIFYLKNVLRQHLNYFLYFDGHPLSL